MIPFVVETNKYETELIAIKSYLTTGKLEKHPGPSYRYDTYVYHQDQDPDRNRQIIYIIHDIRYMKFSYCVDFDDVSFNNFLEIIRYYVKVKFGYDRMTIVYDRKGGNIFFKFPDNTDFYINYNNLLQIYILINFHDVKMKKLINLPYDYAYTSCIENNVSHTCIDNLLILINDDSDTYGMERVVNYSNNMMENNIVPIISEKIAEYADYLNKYFNIETINISLMYRYAKFNNVGNRTIDIKYNITRFEKNLPIMVNHRVRDIDQKFSTRMAYIKLIEYNNFYTDFIVDITDKYVPIYSLEDYKIFRTAYDSEYTNVKLYVRYGYENNFIANFNKWRYSEKSYVISNCQYIKKSLHREELWNKDVTVEDYRNFLISNLGENSVECIECENVKDMKTEDIANLVKIGENLCISRDNYHKLTFKCNPITYQPFSKKERYEFCDISELYQYSPKYNIPYNDDMQYLQCGISVNINIYSNYLICVDSTRELLKDGLERMWKNGQFITNICKYKWMRRDYMNMLSLSIPYIFKYTIENREYEKRLIEYIVRYYD